MKIRTLASTIFAVAFVAGTAHANPNIDHETATRYNALEFQKGTSTHHVKAPRHPSTPTPPNSKVLPTAAQSFTNSHTIKTKPLPAATQSVKNGSPAYGLKPRAKTLGAASGGKKGLPTAAQSFTNSHTIKTKPLPAATQSVSNDSPAYGLKPRAKTLGAASGGKKGLPTATQSFTNSHTIKTKPLPAATQSVSNDSPAYGLKPRAKTLGAASGGKKGLPTAAQSFTNSHTIKTKPLPAATQSVSNDSPAYGLKPRAKTLGAASGGKKGLPTAAQSFTNSHTIKTKPLPATTQSVSSSHTHPLPTMAQSPGAANGHKNNTHISGANKAKPLSFADRLKQAKATKGESAALKKLGVDTKALEKKKKEKSLSFADRLKQAKATKGESAALKKLGVDTKALEKKKKEKSLSFADRLKQAKATKGESAALKKLGVDTKALEKKKKEKSLSFADRLKQAKATKGESAALKKLGVDTKALEKKKKEKSLSFAERLKQAKAKKKGATALETLGVQPKTLQAKKKVALEKAKASYAAYVKAKQNGASPSELGAMKKKYTKERAAYHYLQGKEVQAGEAMLASGASEEQRNEKSMLEAKAKANKKAREARFAAWEKEQEAKYPELTKNRRSARSRGARR
jgi:hypothetical protein